jgi:flagellar biosynthesis/type III secretory pathway M-ring protein FliF/YscJ
LNRITGFTPDRGDQLIVEAMPFESTLYPETEPGLVTPPAPASNAARPLPPWLEALRDPKVGGAVAGGALVLIFLVVFLMRRGRCRGASASTPAALEGSAAAPTLEERMQAQMDERARLEQRLEQEALSSIKLPNVTTKKADVLAKQIKENSKKDSAPGAHVLREWIGEQVQKKSAY